MHYFVSDTHLGCGPAASARERERSFVRWLDRVARDAESVWVLGDLFDFWFEYRRVVPAGFTRVLGKLSELSDRGVAVHFFAGNHDMWVRDYLRRECGVTLHTGPEEVTLAGKRLFLAHGDNLNVGRKPLLRLMNAVFRWRWLRWLFSWLVHPDWAMRFGAWWSGRSRKSHGCAQPFAGAGEPLVRFAARQAAERKIDYFIFGHIHCAERYRAPGLDVLFLGEWLDNPAYAVLNGAGEMELRRWGD